MVAGRGFEPRSRGISRSAANPLIDRANSLISFDIEAFSTSIHALAMTVGPKPVKWEKS